MNSYAINHTASPDVFADRVDKAASQPDDAEHDSREWPVVIWARGVLPTPTTQRSLLLTDEDVYFG